jgi:hypothetical protein
LNSWWPRQKGAQTNCSFGTSKNLDKQPNFLRKTRLNKFKSGSGGRPLVFVSQTLFALMFFRMRKKIFRMAFWCEIMTTADADSLSCPHTHKHSRN